jgi:mRNA-degrading endonuclease RelE of RelBE toxin-antitoxin system
VDHRGAGVATVNNVIAVAGLLDSIEEQLVHEPETATRNRKLLENLTPPWHSMEPIWELRVGEYRVFYDVSLTEWVVYVRAVRKNPRRTKTEDIL